MSADEFRDLTREYPNPYAQHPLVVVPADPAASRETENVVVVGLGFRNFTRRIGISPTLFKIFDQ